MHPVWFATVPFRQKELTAECVPISVTLQTTEFVSVARLTFEFPYVLFQTVQLTTGIGVPEEIAVLGVDDDHMLCESTVPTLSSIRLGSFKCGQKAAEMLDDLMHGHPVQKKNVVMEPMTVVTRESTGYDAMRDPFLARALRFIRAYAAQRHVTVADVVQAAGCSRRYVEQHFRAQLHASVRDIILQTKLERVRTLLEESNFSIGEIAAQCGAVNESHLAVLFKKATGLSMRDYRKQNREPADD